MQALAILFGALFTIAAAWALGRRILPSGEAPVCFLTGAAGLSTVTFAIAAAGLAYPAVFFAVGASILAWGVRRPRPLSAPPLWVSIPCAAFFVLYFFHAMAPEVSPDGAAYHLGLVARYFREHSLVRIPTNLYASLSQGAEMLFLFAFAFGRHSAAALVHLAFLAALAGTMWCYGRRFGIPVAAGAGVVLVVASPIAGIDAASAYTDVALAAAAFGLFYLLQVWDHDREPRALAAIGLLAGFCYAIKYTGGLAIPYALAFVWWKSRRGHDTAIVAAAAAVLVLPWLLKNWLWVGNPVAPFFNQYFPNPYVMVSFEKEYKEMLSSYGLPSRWQIPMMVTTRGLLSGLTGPVFLLSPLAFLSLRGAPGRRLLMAALVFGGLYFSNIGARFLIPALPFVAISLAIALDAVPRLAVAVALLHAAASWPTMVPKYADSGAWRISTRVPWKEALRLRPEEPYLEANLGNYGVGRLIEQKTPPGSTVLTFTPIPEAYTARHIQVVYQSAENKLSGAILWTGFVGEYAPTWRLRFDFARRPLRALRVVQTGTGTRDLWNIHELRIYDGLRELPRDPSWRLTAQPTPWGIQSAFDNSLLTFWISGEWIRPGQFVQVDFARAEPAGAVVIETAPNQWGVRLRLEGRDEQGKWHPLAGPPTPGDAPVPLGLRRAAAEELKRRGIDYILAFDSDFGADDLRYKAPLWGIEPAGEYRTARLYKIL